MQEMKRRSLEGQNTDKVFKGIQLMERFDAIDAEDDEMNRMVRIERTREARRIVDGRTNAATEGRWRRLDNWHYYYGNLKEQFDRTGFVGLPRGQIAERIRERRGFDESELENEWDFADVYRAIMVKKVWVRGEVQTRRLVDRRRDR